jgi:hypothetical protein
MAKPTVAKAPARIPQEIQQEIVYLSVLKNEMDRITAAYERKRDEVTASLTGAVRAVRS